MIEEEWALKLQNRVGLGSENFLWKKHSNGEAEPQSDRNEIEGRSKMLRERGVREKAGALVAYTLTGS